MDRNFLDLVWLCGGVPACFHTGKRQELSSYPWCPTVQGVFDPLFLPSAPQVLLTSDLAPTVLSGRRNHPFLTQVPDVGVMAHAHGCTLELQAGIGHCQLPVPIRVPGEVCGCPLDLLRVPGGEGRESGGWREGGRNFVFVRFLFKKNKIHVGLCNCVHLEIDFTRLKLDSRWLLPVTQHHPRGQFSTETSSQTNKPQVPQRPQS